jgi:hypothetical protein
VDLLTNTQGYAGNRSAMARRYTGGTWGRSSIQGCLIHLERESRRPQKSGLRMDSACGPLRRYHRPVKSAYQPFRKPASRLDSTCGPLRMRKRHVRAACRPFRRHGHLATIRLACRPVDEPRVRTATPSHRYEEGSADPRSAHFAIHATTNQHCWVCRHLRLHRRCPCRCVPTFHRPRPAGSGLSKGVKIVYGWVRLRPERVVGGIKPKKRPKWRGMGPSITDVKCHRIVTSLFLRNVD